MENMLRKKVETVDGEANPGEQIAPHGDVGKHVENATKSVFLHHSDVLEPEISTDIDAEKPTSVDECEVTMKKTKAAQEKSIDPNQFIKHETPFDGPSKQQSVANDSGAHQKVVRMAEMPKLMHGRVPKASSSPPVLVMQHSSPRPIDVQDQQPGWGNAAPCISNLKNRSKGHVVPLDKLLTADGRGLHDVQVKDDFAKLSEALYVTEHKVREAAEARCKIRREVMMKERETKENELRMLAQRARMERAWIGAHTATTGAIATSAVADRGGAVAYNRKGAYDVQRESNETKEERQECMERQALRDDRRKERDTERILEANAGKKRKITRDKDSSEKMDLGMSDTRVGAGEIFHDQVNRFNAEECSDKPCDVPDFEPKGVGDDVDIDGDDIDGQW